MKMTRIPVLSVAGSDCSGGAGIQADLKTILANGCYGMTAITSLTAQNTTGVSGILDVPSDFLGKRIDAVFSDIVPQATKIGMVSSADLIAVIAERLRTWHAKQIVVDPVMVSTSGSRLLREDAVEALCTMLLPIADLLTPNIPETEILTGLAIRTREDMEQAGRSLSERFATAVLVKGGHAIEDASDVLVSDGQITWFPGEKIDNPNTHGTGCTLSSAIACGLAKGFSAADSIRAAKAYLTGALAAGLDLGAGSGPLDHGWRRSAHEF